MLASDMSKWPNGQLSRLVEAVGMRWHVQMTGHGPAILLIHGTGASTHTWRDVLPLLAAHYTVVAVDLPGHGFTDSPSGARSSMVGMGDGIAVLLRKLQVDPTYCVGHSAGAAILCRMVLDGRMAPRSIVSINGALVPLAGAAGILFSPMARLLASNSLLPRLLAWRAGTAASVARAIERTGSHLGRDGVELYARLVRDPRHVAGALAMMGHWDLYAFERELPRLETPLALIVGENDRMVPPHQALAVKRRVATAEVYSLPELGHLAHEEQPELLVGQLLKIFAVNSLGGASANRSDQRSEFVD